MSVINKMLRDLDSRRPGAALPGAMRKARSGMASETVSVHNSDDPGKRRSSLPLGVVLALSLVVVAGAAGSWWYLFPTGFFERKGDSAKLIALPATKPSVVSAAPASEPAAPSGPPPATPSSDNTVPKSAAEQLPVSAKLSQEVLGLSSAENRPKIDRPPLAAPKPAKSSQAETVTTPRSAPERPITERPASQRPVTSAPNAPAAAVSAHQAPQRRAPLTEALAQGQGLWNSGSRQAAIDLLSDALVAAERASPVGTPAGSQSELVLLARELARMDLSEGRPGAALEMLTRLEPALSAFADVWAIRGNAAQRLGRHQESAAAYLMALKLRPDEPRWMLGAAVSLAAQGQTASAAEFAEKARLAGVLSPEVTSYLRQLGVPLR